LNSKYVIESAIVPLGPQLIPVDDVDQSSGDANASARTANASLEDRSDIQLFPDLRDADAFSFE